MDPGGRRVDDGDPVRHPAAQDAAVELGCEVGELDAVVDALGLQVVVQDVAADPVAASCRLPDHIGEVELALGVLRLETRQPFGEELGVEDVDAGVDLGDPELVGTGVAVLDDPGDPVAVADDPSVAGGVRQHGGEDGDRVALFAVGGHQVDQGLPGEQRDVAAGDDDLSGDPGQGGEAAADGVAGAARLGLQRHAGLWRDIGEVSLHLVASVPDDHDEVVGFKGAGGVHGVGDHGAAGELVQHLGHCRFHPCARAGGHDDDRSDARRLSCGVFGHQDSQPRLRSLPGAQRASPDGPGGACFGGCRGYPKSFTRSRGRAPE